MSYTDRINEAIKKLPDQIAVKVHTDIDKRISDWLSAGGKEDDDYVMQQVIYAESAAAVYERKVNES